MQTEHLKITGMTCDGCAAKVTQALKAVAGVGEVSVSLANHEATVQYDAEKATPDQLTAAITQAGYGLGEASAPKAKPGCC